MTLLAFVATPPDGVLDLLPSSIRFYATIGLGMLGYLSQRAWKFGKILIDWRDEQREARRLMLETRHMVLSEDGKSGLSVEVQGIVHTRIPAIEYRVENLEEFVGIHEKEGERRHRNRRARDGGDSA